MKVFMNWAVNRSWQSKVLDTWKVMNWAINRNLQSKVLDTWKVTQLTDIGRPKYVIHGRSLS